MAVDLTELDQRIKLQNIEYYELYDLLAKNLTKKDQIEILKSNRQFIPATKPDVCIFFITQTDYFIFRMSISNVRLF